MRGARELWLVVRTAILCPLKEARHAAKPDGGYVGVVLAAEG